MDLTPVEPLSIEQMRNVVERRGGDISRVPFFWHKSCNTGTMERHGERLEKLNEAVVDDVLPLYWTPPGDFEAPEEFPPDYKWAIEDAPPDATEKGITSRRVISSTDLIDEFIEAMPLPAAFHENAYPACAIDANPNRYRVGFDLFTLFERAWFLFGMENTLCEMALNPERFKRLMAAFTGYHKQVIENFAALGAHAYFATDDLGSQDRLLFSQAQFRELFLPFYEEMIDHCHGLGMTFWLHSDGAITELLDDLIAVGVDALHPIQPHSMDPAVVTEKCAGRITFIAGIDVQVLLPGGSVEEVRSGTRELIDAFDSAEGGLILSTANAIMPETPFDNIFAWFDTAQRYGMESRRRFR
jgi:hypothetical protein